MNKPLKFFLFGDSICFGQLVSPHQTWVNYLSIKSAELFKDKITIQNCSVNGDTTRLALERFGYQISTKNPDVVLVQFGMNDCNFWDTGLGLPRVSKLAFEANLVEIINNCFVSGSKIVFLSTNHPSNKSYFKSKPELTHGKSNKHYNHIIKNVYKKFESENKKVFLLDNEKLFENELFDKKIAVSNFLLEDGVHLNVNGHLLYRKTVDKILKILKSKL